MFSAVIGKWLELSIPNYGTDIVRGSH